MSKASLVFISSWYSLTSWAKSCLALYRASSNFASFALASFRDASPCRPTSLMLSSKCRHWVHRRSQVRERSLVISQAPYFPSSFPFEINKLGRTQKCLYSCMSVLFNSRYKLWHVSKHTGKHRDMPARVSSPAHCHHL